MGDAASGRSSAERKKLSPAEAENEFGKTQAE
jgi:hypothetical protein